MYKWGSYSSDFTNSRWPVVAAVVLLLAYGVSPGEIITLKADCTCGSEVGDTQPQSTAQCSMIVCSPVYRDWPVFLAMGWKHTTRLKTGEVMIFHDTVAQGMLVRAFVNTSRGVQLLDGILTRDGRIAVGGNLYDLAEEPEMAGHY
jgi:hypothetical protein